MKNTHGAAGTPHFKSWNIFDSALIKNPNGHHYWETKAFVDELVRRGETVRLFSHVMAPPATQFPGAEIIPAFSMYPYKSVSNDPMWWRLENFVVRNRATSAELSELAPSMFEQSVLLFPTLWADQLLGLFRWLATFPLGTAPRTAVCLVPPHEWSAADRAVEFYRVLWKNCPPAIKERVAIFGRTPQIAELFATHTGIPSRVYPFPCTDDLFASRKVTAPGEADAPMVVSFVGGTRKERGGELIADAVQQCSGSGVQFFIHVRNGGDTNFDTKALTALSAHPNVRLHEGPLDRQAFYSAIANTVVLLPYRPQDYRSRDSAVYLEAKLLDSPALVTAGTWMADEVKSLGNGLVIEDFSANAVVECIQRAQHELPALKAAAARVGREVREKNGVSRCLDAIAEACSSPPRQIA